MESLGWKREWKPVFPSSLPLPPSSGATVQTGGCPGPGVTGASISRLQFWNLEFESQSFLYRQVGFAWASRDGDGPEELGHYGSLGLVLQVRRMTAVLVAVGLGALMPAQVKVILESRDPLGRHQTRVAPAHGLFLKSVQYGSLGKGRQPGKVPSCTPMTEPLPRWGA